MTKTLAALAALAAAALALAPAAQAHGAAPAREIDARVLLDDDGAVEYGGCVEDVCPATPPGLDLLALDVREAWLGDEPAIAFRIVTQSEGTGSGQLLLSLTADGATREFTVDDAAAPGAGSTFDAVAGPFDAFDGHPKAVDGWVRLSTLGATVGDTLTGIAVTSLAAGEPDDAMPGGWYSNGQEVPHLPHDADPAEATSPRGPGSYVVKGPAPLLSLEPATALLDLSKGGNLTLRLGNPLAGMAQGVTLSVLLPGGGSAQAIGGLDRANLTLDPAAMREATFRAAPGSPGGNVTILATTDLGGRATATLQLVAPPPPPTDEEPATAASSGGKPSPAPAAVLLALGLLAFAGVRRK